MGKGTGPKARPYTLGGSAVLVAIDDDLFDAQAPTIREVFETNQMPFELVRASTLADPNTQADFYFGRYVPTAPDCERVLTCVSDGRFLLFEQDKRSGAVYRGGRLVWPSAPLVVTTFDGGRDDALLFAQGRQCRITTIPDVILRYRAFTTRAPGPDEVITQDWIERAAALLASTVPPRRLA